MGKKQRIRREREAAELAEVVARSSGSPGFELKLDRAEQHLNLLTLAVTEWIDAHPNLIQEETDLETGDGLVVVDAPAAPPADAISLIAADCIHNLRASLDQLVFALAWANTAGPLTEKDARRCEFPVYGPRAPKVSDLARRIGAIDPGAQALIAGFQPYNAGPQYAEEKLWILDQLWNLDKHRMLPVTVFGQHSVRLNPQAVPSGSTFRVAGPIRTKTEIIRYPGGFPDPRPDPAEAMDLDIAFGLGTGAYGHPVVLLLSEIAEYLRQEVVGKLTPFLS